VFFEVVSAASQHRYWPRASRLTEGNTELVSVLSQTYHFKNTGPKATVATSALADKALSGNGRRLLRRTVRKWPFHKSRPESQNLAQRTGSEPLSELAVWTWHGLAFRLLNHVQPRSMETGNSKLIELDKPGRQAHPVGSASTAARLPHFDLTQESPGRATQAYRSRKRAAEQSSLGRSQPALATDIDPQTDSLESAHAASLQPLTHKQLQTHEAPDLQGAFQVSHSSSAQLRRLQAETGLPAGTDIDDHNLDDESNGGALAQGRRLVTQSQSMSVKLIGRPNWQACQDLVDRVVTTSTECEEQPCALGAHQPVRNELWRGFFFPLFC
jgi:hypothetical protein